MLDAKVFSQYLLKSFRERTTESLVRFEHLLNIGDFGAHHFGVGLPGLGTDWGTPQVNRQISFRHFFLHGWSTHITQTMVWPASQAQFRIKDSQIAFLQPRAPHHRYPQRFRVKVVGC